METNNLFSFEVIDLSEITTISNDTGDSSTGCGLFAGNCNGSEVCGCKLFAGSCGSIPQT